VSEAATTVAEPVVAGVARPAAPVARLTAGLHDHRRAVRIASVLLAVVVVGLSARACLAPAAVVVPPIVAGTTVDIATQALAAQHLDAVRTTETSKTVAAGRVIRTDPAPGATAHEGDDVTLVVSSGKPTVTLSSTAYVGKSPATVRTSLQSLGFVPSLTYDGKGTPAGTVSGVTPTGSLTYGAAVTMHVVPVPRAPSPDKKKHGKR
jgi:serine/threonine-protein kinase